MTTPPEPELSFPAYERAAWNMFEACARALMAADGLTEAGLMQYREALIRGFWQAEPGQLPLQPDIAARKSVLLDDVCRAVAAVKGWDEWPFPNDLIHLDVPDHLGTDDD